MSQHNAPQDDLTVERAAAVEEQISDAINRLAYPVATIRRIVKDAIKTARQEAMREAVKCLDDHAHEGPDAAYVALHRLASEGG